MQQYYFNLGQEFLCMFIRKIPHVKIRTIIEFTVNHTKSSQLTAHWGMQWEVINFRQKKINYVLEVLLNLTTKNFIRIRFGDS